MGKGSKGLSRSQPAKGLSPHAHPECLSLCYLCPCHAGAARCRERQCCRYCMQAALCCVLPACTLACLAGRGEVNQQIEARRRPARILQTGITQGTLSPASLQPAWSPAVPATCYEYGTQPAGILGSPWLSLSFGIIKPDIPLGCAAGSTLEKTQLGRELLHRKKSFSRKFPPRKAARFPGCGRAGNEGDHAVCGALSSSLLGPQHGSPPAPCGHAEWEVPATHRHTQSC